MYYSHSFTKVPFDFFNVATSTLKSMCISPFCLASYIYWTASTVLKPCYFKCGSCTSPPRPEDPNLHFIRLARIWVRVQVWEASYRVSSGFGGSSASRNAFSRLMPAAGVDRSSRLSVLVYCFSPGRSCLDGAGLPTRGAVVWLLTGWARRWGGKSCGVTVEREASEKKTKSLFGLRLMVNLSWGKKLRRPGL